MKVEDYEKLLDRAVSQLPPGILERKGLRRELPRPEVSVTGNRTILRNFKEICDALNREPQSMLRFLAREMATAGSVEGVHAVFQGRFSSDSMEQLLNRYVQDYQMCPVCKSIDTKIVKEGRYHFLRCEACGARSSIRPV